MKFFKHYVDADVGTLNELMNRLGVDAYGRYWLLTALCVSTIDKPKEKPYKEADMKFTFNSRQLREKLRIKSTNLQVFLGTCSELTLFQWDLVDDKYNFYFPNILKFMDRDSKRARTIRASSAPKRKRESKSNSNSSSDEIKTQISLIYQSHYPRKQGLTDGIKKLITQLKTEADLVEFETATKRYADHIERSRTPTEFVLHFKTFAGQWRDWLAPDAGLVVISRNEPYVVGEPR